MSSTQAASHGAGQMRPVNSGKLFVASAIVLASRQRPRKTASFQSGIRLPSGQPEWQNGTPHSMQRAPWSRRPAIGSCCWYSWKSPTRSATGRLGPLRRSIRRKPPSSPMRGHHTVLDRARGGGGRRLVARLLGALGGLAQGALVVPRHHLDPGAGELVPVLEHPARDAAIGALGVLRYE